MPKESIIKHYSSSTTGSVPLAADLVEGELAINTADERIYFENASGQVVNFGESKGISATYARRSSVVSSLNGLTGALTITGTANEIEVTTTTPNIVVGLRDSVTIDNLIVTQDITATRFSGSLVGRVSNAAKNTESYTLTAGTPVYISGYVGGGASGILEVKAAAANNSSTMPAVGLIETTLAANGEGRVVTFGLLGGLNTNGFTAGQTLFIAPSGGLTATRPTSGSHLVQNIGRVANISTNQGEIIVLGPGRSNDVPNNITVRGFLEMPNGQTATSIVTTVNGLSGAITNVAVTNATNTFTAFQRFNAGLSATDSIFVGKGATSIEIGFRVISDNLLAPPSNVIKANDSQGLYVLYTGGTASSFVMNSNGFSFDHDGVVVNGLRRPTLGIGGTPVGDGTTLVPSAHRSRIALNNYHPIDGFYTTTINRSSVSNATNEIELPHENGVLALTRNLVSSFNGLTGAATMTGDGGAIVGVANNAVRARLATASLTGVASFPATDFAVSAAGAVSVTGNFVRTVVVGGSTLTGNVSLTAGSNITLTPSGNTITIASTASGGGGVTTTAQNTWTATQYFNAGLSATGATFTGNQTVSGSLTVTNGITFGSGTTFMEFIPRGSASPASSGGGLWIRGGDLQIGGTDWGDPGLFSFRGLSETHQLFGNFTLNTPNSYQAAQNTLTLNTSSSHTGRPLRISRGTDNFIAGCEPNGTWFGAGMQEISSLAGLTFSANPIRMAGLGMNWSYTDIMAGTFVTVTPTSGAGNKPTQITFDDMKVVADEGLAIGAGAINARTGTAGYTLVAGDNGKVITIDSASAVTLTAGTDVGTTGFSCSVIQLGAGQVTIAGSGVTLNSYSGLKIQGQHGAASIVCYATNTFNVAGNLTT